jgi:acetylornithine deacetylase
MPALESTPANVVELLQSTVRINSVNVNYSGRQRPEEGVLRYYEGAARAMGFETRTMSVPGQCDNLIVTHRSKQAGSAGKWLMFESHMDTVVVDGMTIDPFGARVDGGRLWGRGSCDTKGTGAAMLWALQDYARAAQQPNHVAIAFTVDEEYGMTGVRALVKEWDRLGFRPVGVIVGEPTMLKPISAHNGVVRWKVKTRGVAAHSADPSRGHSAISDMAAVIQAIESEYIPRLDARHPMTGKAQCSINQISGGSQINIIPAACEIALDRRIVPGEDGSRVLADVEKVLQGLKSKLLQFDFEQEPIFACPPLSDRHNGGLLRVVQTSLSKLGLPTEPCGVAYATDGGDLDAAGIPAIVLGPGDIAQAHTKDEWIALDQLHRGVKVYRELMHAAL